MTALTAIGRSRPRCAQLLDQCVAAGRLLDQDPVGTEAPVEFEHGAAKIGVFHAPAQDIEQVPLPVAAPEPPGGAHGVVAARIGSHSRIPALYHFEELAAFGALVVGAEPLEADHVTLGSDRLLLVLGREHERTEMASQLIERVVVLLRRVEQVAGLAHVHRAAAEGYPFFLLAMAGRLRCR